MVAALDNGLPSRISMAKFIFGTLFALLMAVNVALFMYITRDLGGSKVKTTHSISQQQVRPVAPPN